MGARSVGSGLSKANAQVVADTGIDLAAVACAADLWAGIQRANAMLPIAVVPLRSRA